MTKGQTTIYRTPHRKLKIEQRDAHGGEHRKGSQYILHKAHLLCYSRYQRGNVSYLFSRT